jgi:hypothetical protein
MIKTFKIFSYIFLNLAVFQTLLSQSEGLEGTTPANTEALQKCLMDKKNEQLLVLTNEFINICRAQNQQLTNLGLPHCQEGECPDKIYLKTEESAAKISFEIDISEDFQTIGVILQLPNESNINKTKVVCSEIKNMEWRNQILFNASQFFDNLIAAQKICQN